jgi:uncharacterized membrane protein (UPF0136 family)
MRAVKWMLGQVLAIMVVFACSIFVMLSAVLVGIIYFVAGCLMAVAFFGELFCLFGIFVLHSPAAVHPAWAFAGMGAAAFAVNIALSWITTGLVFSAVRGIRSRGARDEPFMEPSGRVQLAFRR